MTKCIVCLEEGKYNRRHVQCNHTPDYEIQYLSDPIMCAAAITMLLFLGLIQYSATLNIDMDESRA